MNSNSVTPEIIAPAMARLLGFFDKPSNENTVPRIQSIVLRMGTHIRMSPNSARMNPVSPITFDDSDISTLAAGVGTL